MNYKPLREKRNPQVLTTDKYLKREKGGMLFVVECQVPAGKCGIQEFCTFYNHNRENQFKQELSMVAKSRKKFNEGRILAGS